MRKHESRPRAPQAVDMLSVYDGHTWRGSVAEVRGAFIAYDTAGNLVGKFSSFRAAVRAVPQNE
jgi:hypothetical protein